jgi:hypothetical protein
MKKSSLTGTKRSMTKTTKTWSAPGWAYIPTVEGKKLKVWVSYLSPCLKYAVVSQTKNDPKNSVLASDLSA